MRRRSEDNAGTARDIFIVTREVARARLPANGAVVLSLLDQHPEGQAAFAKLVQDCDLPQSKVSYICEQLIAKGLIVRTVPLEDRRKTVIAITPHGRAVFGKLKKRINSATHFILKIERKVD